MAESGPETAAKRSRSTQRKTDTAFRTIGEVADLLDLPQHVLRFWEKKFHQIRPVKRNGGRRYYRTEDIALLTEIRGLLHDQGYTIKGVQKLLRDGGMAKAVRARAQGKAATGKAAGNAGKSATTTSAAGRAESRQIGMPFDLLSDMGNLKTALKTCLHELEAIHADIMARHGR